MTRDELIKQIGEHVFNTFDKWVKEGKGSKIHIPVMIPRIHFSKKEFGIIFPRLDSKWSMTVTCEAPRLAMYTGNGDVTYLSPSEVWELEDRIDSTSGSNKSNAKTQ